MKKLPKLSNDDDSKTRNDKLKYYDEFNEKVY